jgi:hypothetical protein
MRSTSEPPIVCGNESRPLTKRDDSIQPWIVRNVQPLRIVPVVHEVPLRNVATTLPVGADRTSVSAVNLPCASTVATTVASRRATVEESRVKRRRCIAGWGT